MVTIFYFSLIPTKSSIYILTLISYKSKLARVHMLFWGAEDGNYFYESYSLTFERRFSLSLKFSRIDALWRDKCLVLEFWFKLLLVAND